MDDRIKEAERLIKRGGQLIATAYYEALAQKRAPLAKQEKTAHDFVTEIDQSIEDMIAQEVGKHFPEDGILGEENEEITGTSGYSWVVDPLDGTNNFVKGVPLFGIQVALYKDDAVVYSAALNPFAQQLYTARKGAGAFVEHTATGERFQMHVTDNRLSESMMVFSVDIAQGDPEKRAIFDAFMGKIGWIRIFGVAIVDLPLVAMGSTDILVSTSTKAVDIAPGGLMVEEAGGRVTDFDGNPWSIHAKNIIMSNGRNHDEALTILQQARAKAS